jgi:hypothetical protein
MISFLFSASAEPQNPNSSEPLSVSESLKAIDDIIVNINSEYGTNMHRVTAEEAWEKYGIVLNKSAQTQMTANDLAQFEKRMRYTAEVGISNCYHITKGIDLSESILREIHSPLSASSNDIYSKTLETGKSYYNVKTGEYLSLSND